MKKINLIWIAVLGGAAILLLRRVPKSGTLAKGDGFPQLSLSSLESTLVASANASKEFVTAQAKSLLSSAADASALAAGQSSLFAGQLGLLESERSRIDAVTAKTLEANPKDLFKDPASTLSSLFNPAGGAKFLL